MNSSDLWTPGALGGLFTPKQVDTALLQIRKKVPSNPFVFAPEVNYEYLWYTTAIIYIRTQYLVANIWKEVLI